MMCSCCWLLDEREWLRLGMRGECTGDSKLGEEGQRSST